MSATAPDQLEVSRSLVVVSGGLAEKSTKTDRARQVALDDVGVASSSSIEPRSRSCIDRGVHDRANAYIFSPEPDGSTPFRPDNVTSFFIRVRDQLDLKESGSTTCDTSPPRSSSGPVSMFERSPAGSDTPIPPSP